MQRIDTLLHAHWVIPVEPTGDVLEHTAIALHNGHILELLPSSVAREKYQAELNTELDRHVLLPGLINAHGHAAMSLMRGLADDMALMEWLNQHIWPTEQRWVSAEFVLEGSRLACAEMLRGGTTCFNDMYYFPDQAARAAAQAGMRAVVGLIVIDFPTVWAQDVETYLHKGLALHDELKNNTLITTAFAPHAPYTVSDAPLERIRMYAEELDIPVHIHLHETAHEVDEAVRQDGQRPLARLDALGLLGPHLVGVHMTQISEAEIARYAEAGAHVVHCPESNLKLASGFCPLAALEEAGVNIAIGTDGAASNNDLDMFSEMRTAALLAKAVAGDPRVIPAQTALRMATLGGARALGLDGITGSLLPGKAADIIAVDLGDIETQPVYHPLSQLVYATGRDKVTDVWVAGRQVLKDRTLTTLDVEELRDSAHRWQQRLRENHSP